MLQVKQELLAALGQALDSLLPGSGNKAAFESPKVAAHGDYAVTAAMQLAKPLKLNPRQLGEQLRDALLASPAYQQWVQDIEIAGPGFINIRLKPAAKQQIVREVLAAKAQFGFQADNGQRVLVEFVSANPTGPLHVGHGRQAALGDAICNLFETQGWNVHREFYYNDAGVQIATLAASVQARAKAQHQRHSRSTSATLKRSGEAGSSSSLGSARSVEGAASGGFQTVMLVGIRDRHVLGHIDRFLEKMHQVLGERVRAAMGDAAEGCHISLRPYGWNAVSGTPVPAGTPAPQEIGLLFIATASTQELATQVAKTCNPWFFHLPLEEAQELPSYGFPFSPAELERGQVFEFKLNHVVSVSDPMERVRTRFVEVEETAHA